MSTRIVMALVLALILVVVAVPAVADGTYRVSAVVTSYEMTSYGDVEIEVVDADGNLWTYYADEAHIGDLVILTVFDFEDLSYEDDEIVDAETITSLSVKEIVNWLK